MDPVGTRGRVLLACDGMPGVGGLGLQAAFALKALHVVADVDAVGPGRFSPASSSVRWHGVASPVPEWAASYTPLRWRPGLRVELTDRKIAAAAAGLARAGGGLSGCYAFTGVALELFEIFAVRGQPRILDSPNGHIRGFRDVIDREARKLLGGTDRTHPTPAMVGRIQREYGLATMIRVASEWARRSLIAGGVAPAKVHVAGLEVDVQRFSPPSMRVLSPDFRVCYAGSVDLRKGVVYLLRALRALGQGVALRIVGAPGSRSIRKLVETESIGLQVAMRPGDPVEAYRSSDVFVLPTLEDGFGYVVAEAMACGLPVIATDACGAAEWITPGKTGWIVPAGSAEALAVALAEARQDRARLLSMGVLAREVVIEKMNVGPANRYASWLGPQLATVVTSQ